MPTAGGQVTVASPGLANLTYNYMGGYTFAVFTLAQGRMAVEQRTIPPR